MTLTLTTAYAATSPINEMIPVTADSVPLEFKRDARQLVVPGTGWTEIGSITGACRYGCKIYARRQGAVIRYAVFHSSTYGHPLNAR